MEGDQEDMSPFWQPTSRRHRRSRWPSSGFFLVVLLFLALLVIFIIIPSFLSFTSQVLKPHAVKKGWDSLNLVLVLFAIICGFLSRNGGGEENSKNPFEEDRYRGLSRSQDSFRRSYSSPRTPQRFLFDQDLSGSIRSYNNGKLNRLRSFSSYPDLRQHGVEEEDQEGSSWGYQWRFYDDTHLYNYRSSSVDQQTVLAPPQTEEKKGGKEEDGGGGGGEDVKDVSVGVDCTNFVSEKEKEKEVVHNASPPPYMAAETVEEEAVPPEVLESPPLPPPTKVVRRRVRRTYDDVGKSERRKKDDLGESTSNSPPPPLPPPSPPSPPPYTAAFEESGKSEKKRSGASATKEFLNSLKRKKKKKQRQKSVENLDSFFNYESSYSLPTTPPPPPPPPPPPFFQSLFSSKKRKTKKIHTIQSYQSSPPPPPPPPPRRQPPRTQQLSRKTAVKNTAYTATQKPPVPVKIRSYNNMVEENTNSGGESPMKAIPPPPPLPPFNIPVWKFEVHGDYVRLKSNNDIDAEETGSPYSDGGGGTAVEGGDTVTPPLFCPSPDVNTKADDFIKKFRDGLRLEKMNSVKGKEGRVGRSNLGPQLGPEPGPS